MNIQQQIKTKKSKMFMKSHTDKKGCVRHSYTSRIFWFTIRETEITNILLGLFI